MTRGWRRNQEHILGQLRVHPHVKYRCVVVDSCRVAYFISTPESQINQPGFHFLPFLICHPPPLWGSLTTSIFKKLLSANSLSKICVQNDRLFRLLSEAFITAPRFVISPVLLSSSRPSLLPWAVARASAGSLAS